VGSFLGTDVIFDQILRDLSQGNFSLSHPQMRGDLRGSAVLKLLDSLTEEVAEKEMASDNIYAMGDKFAKLH